jgi:oxygen-independent coproporphyrinogen-3 oxidase
MKINPTHDHSSEQNGSASPAIGTGLYVHVPFCIRKCLYCDFISYADSPDQTTAYTQDLLAEMRFYACMKEFQTTRFTTLFIGGGTPTLLPVSHLEQIIHTAVELSVTPPIEITIEANPGTVTLASLQTLRQIGVNRLSLGVQSFNDQLLKVLGRIHTTTEAVTAVRWARQAGFTNINMDLMFALPGQSLLQWQATLNAALELQPEHISCYSLIVEEDTPFGQLRAKGALRLPSEDLEAEMYEYALQRLNDVGYEHYEISNFARPGYRCQHNQIYWRYAPYLGLGCGAHSYWGSERWANVNSLREYRQLIQQGRLPVAERYVLTKDDQMDEYMMLGLRMRDGVSAQDFHHQFGCQLTAIYGTQLEKLQSYGLVHYDGDRCYLTKRGLLLGNQVFAAFLRG